MDSNTVTVRVIQALGLSVSAWISGAQLSISAFAIPPLKLAPATLLSRQWAKLYVRGQATFPWLYMVSTISCGYLAYHFYQRDPKSSRWQLYLLAGASSLIILPFTILVIGPTNDKLLAKAAEASLLEAKEKIAEVGLPKGESTKELVDLWSRLNIVRGLVMIGGTIFGALATFKGAL